MYFEKSFVSRLVAFVQSESLRLIVCTSFFNNIVIVVMYCVETNKEYKIHVCNSSLPVGYKGLFTWSGGPRSSGVGFFCFLSPRA